MSVPATKPHARASSAQTQAAIRSKFNNEATVAVPGWPAKAAKIFLEAVDNALTGHDELGLETAGDLLVSAQPPALSLSTVKHRTLDIHAEHRGKP